MSIESGSLPNYTALKSCGYEFSAAAKTVDGKIFAAALNDDASNAGIYSVDPNTLEATLLGNLNAGVGVMDITDAPHLGNCLMGVYGTYVMMIDKDTGAFQGAWNWSEDGSALVGIAYCGSVLNTYYNVKHKVDEKVLTIQRKLFLSGYEGEASSQLQQEVLQVINQCLLQLEFV